MCAKDEAIACGVRWTLTTTTTRHAMRCTRVWEVGDRSPRDPSCVARQPFLWARRYRSWTDSRRRRSQRLRDRLSGSMPLSRQRGANSTESEPNALTVCPWCWGAHAECPYSATEAAAARKARKARKAVQTGRDTGSGEPPVLSAQSDARLQSEMRNAGSATPGLFGISRRRRGPKPSLSRQARWRRRHPEEAARHLARLRARSAPEDAARAAESP